MIYLPETERASHYFQAILPRQFDEYVWFDETHAVTPFDTEELAGLPDTYPLGCELRHAAPAAAAQAGISRRD